MCNPSDLGAGFLFEPVACLADLLHAITFLKDSIGQRPEGASPHGMGFHDLVRQRRTLKEYVWPPSSSLRPSRTVKEPVVEVPVLEIWRPVVPLCATFSFVIMQGFPPNIEMSTSSLQRRNA